MLRENHNNKKINVCQLHNSTSQKTVTDISNAVATPNIGETRRLREKSYSDRLPCSKWSQLNAGVSKAHSGKSARVVHFA